MTHFDETTPDTTTNHLRQRPHIEIIIATHPTDPEAVESSIRCAEGPPAHLVIDALLDIVDEIKRRALA